MKIQKTGVYAAFLVLSACGETPQVAVSGDQPGLRMTALTTVPDPCMGKNPIVFVHGYDSGSGVWTTMKNRFATDLSVEFAAKCLYSFDYAPKGSNKDNAAKIKEDIELALKSSYGDGNTAGKKVDIIAVSMGSLSSRYYIRYLMGDIVKVDAWVSLAGPNHGTKTAYICSSSTDIACIEMRPNSSFLISEGGLNYGGSDAETPYDTAIRYGTWRSKCDLVINPVDSVVLKQGAYNYYTPVCISHSDFVNEAKLYAEVRDFVTKGPLAKATSP